MLCCQRTDLVFIVATSELDQELTFTNYAQQNRVVSEIENEQNEVEALNETDMDESFIYFRSSKRNVLADSPDEDEIVLDRSIDEHNEIKSLILPQDWDPGPPHVVKYVDDILGVEKIHSDAGKTLSSIHKQKITIHANQSEELIEQIKKMLQC